MIYGSFNFVCSTETLLQLWNIEQKQLLSQIIAPSSVVSLFDSNGLIAAASIDGKVFLWHDDTLEEVFNDYDQGSLCF